MTEWLAWWEIEHLGGPEERADLRMGILGSITANAHRDPDVKPDPFAVADFLPRFEDPDEDTGSATSMSPEAFSAMMHARFPGAG